MMKTSSNELIGKRFIGILIGILILAIGFYAVCHLLVKDQIPCPDTDAAYNPCMDPPCKDATGTVTWKNFARLDPSGHVRLRNVGEIDWYVGAKQAKEILENVRDRAEEMDAVQVRVRSELEKISRDLLYPEITNEISELVIVGDYNAAYLRLNRIALESATADMGKIKQDLLFLDQQIKAQCIELEGLAPPLSRMFFWTSPTLSIFEVLFWAFFGVLTNLLVSSAEYLRKGNFQPIETWVAFPKLIYGPILAVVLVLSIINGFFTVESYKLRVWTLPLVGFLFGYAARRTARLVDKLIEKFLGKAEQGITQGPQAVTAQRQAMVDDLKKALKPKNMEDFRSQAKKLAKEITETQVNKREGK